MRRRKSIFAPGESRGTKINPIQMSPRIGDADRQLGFLAGLDRIRKVRLKGQLGHNAVSAQFSVAINFRTQAGAANRNNHALARFEFWNFNFTPPPGDAQVISVFKGCPGTALRFVVRVRPRAERAPKMFLNGRRERPPATPCWSLNACQPPVGGLTGIWPSRTSAGRYSVSSFHEASRSGQSLQSAVEISSAWAIEMAVSAATNRANECFIFGNGLNILICSWKNGSGPSIRFGICRFVLLSLS